MSVANDDNDHDADHISLASSLSSIPIKDLKGHLSRQRKLMKQNASKDLTHVKLSHQSVRKNVTKPKPIKSKRSTTATKRALKVTKALPSTETESIIFNERIKVPTINGGIGSEGLVHHKQDDDDDDDDPPLAMACCLCHCGLDCADRTLFFKEDRIQELLIPTEQAKAQRSPQQLGDDGGSNQTDDMDFTLDDPYFPIQAHDPHNALVYCDGCSRLYHQKCHFVPLFILPRGKWYCLFCTTSNTNTTNTKKATIGTSTSTKSSTTALTFPWNPNVLFQSPPNPLARKWEQEWEHRTAGITQPKLWHQQLAQTLQFCKTQASNIRLASAQLETMNSIPRIRQHLLAFAKQQYRIQSKANHNNQKSSLLSSQQLADTLFKLTSSKWKVRTLLLSLEQYRRQGNHVLSNSVLTWAQEQQSNKSHPKIMAYLFPHGFQVYNDQRRTVPRTAEWKGYDEDMDRDVDECNVHGGWIASVHATTISKLPSVISIIPDNPHMKSSKPCLPLSEQPFQPTSFPQQQRGKRDSKTSVKINGDNNGDDNDSGISLDDLQCCICKVGDATDENDVLLCDGEGCCRAFHMACVWPPVTMDDLKDNHEDEDWFCPLCQALPNFLSEIQEACMDEEWVYRKETSRNNNLNKTTSQKKGHDSVSADSSSLQSWNCAADVFPDAEWQMTASKRLKTGPQHHPGQPDGNDIARLLSTFLGPDFLPVEEAGLPVGSDSEDENDYSLFDEASFEKRKKHRNRGQKKSSGEEESGNDETTEASDHSAPSTRSSDATLQEMSSVELVIDRDELAALSDGGDDGDDSSSSSLGNRRVSKRLRSKAFTGSVQSSSVGRSSSGVDGNLADFDPANIVQGKRRRTTVDYRKLNDALFGDLTELEQAKLDDHVDYQYNSCPKMKKTKRTTKKKPAHQNGKEQSANQRRKNSSKSRGYFQNASGDDDNTDDVNVDDDDASNDQESRPSVGTSASLTS